MHPLMKKIEEKYIKKNLCQFRIGDTVKVHIKIIEGEKERIQIYAGLVIAKRGSGFSESFTVSRVTFGYANEKIFPNSSPSITQVEVVRRGKVRKAKLTYLRGKIGKAAKVEGIFSAEGSLAQAHPGQI